MDARVDLTANRDFRDRRRKNTVPRSIFNRNRVEPSRNIIPGLSNIVNRQIRFISNPNYTTTMSTTNNLDGWVTYNDATSSSLTAYNSYPPDDYNYGEICDRCGKDITRLPWQEKSYGCLCKECFNIVVKQSDKRIPWRR